MGIRRVQDLEIGKQLNGTDLFEVSEKLKVQNSVNGYISKNITFQDLVSQLSGCVNTSVMEEKYVYTDFPIGSVVYSSVDLADGDYLSGNILPADGLEMIYDSQISANTLVYDISSSNRVVQVTRNDLHDIFAQFRVMCQIIDGEYHIRDGFNVVLVDDTNTYSETQNNAQKGYLGFFKYSINKNWLKLPNLDNIYLKGTTEGSNVCLYTPPSVPNIRGQFVNGISKNDLVDYKNFESYYRGVIGISNDDNVKYFYNDNTIANQIYRKSLTKNIKDMNLYSLDPNNALSCGSVYSSPKGDIILDSTCLRPYIVVSKRISGITDDGGGKR